MIHFSDLQDHLCPYKTQVLGLCRNTVITDHLSNYNIPTGPWRNVPSGHTCKHRVAAFVKIDYTWDCRVCMILDQAVGSLYTITFFTGKFVELLPPMTSMPSPARASLFPLRHRQVAFFAMLGHSRADVLTKAHLTGISARHVWSAKLESKF